MSYSDPTGLLPFDDVDEEAYDGAPRRRRRRARRLLLAVVLVLLALLALPVGGLWVASERYAGNVERIPSALPAVPEQQRPQKAPAGPASKSLTFLLVGSDARSDAPTTGDGETYWAPGAQRTDTIMLVHLTGRRDKAYVVSIPRDSWVAIPGRGKNKINAAYAFGGPPLLVQTLEQLTGVRIDHVAAIDFQGFRTMTDALGGVDITVREPTAAPGGGTWAPGTYTLDGDEALAYVRERYRLPRGDFDRVQRQQNFLRSLMNQALSSGTVTNPVKLSRFVRAVTNSVGVDEGLSNGDIRRLALGLRSLRRGDVEFLTVPVAGTGYEGAASVVYLDDKRANALWQALRADDVETFLATTPTDRLGRVVR